MEFKKHLYQILFPNHALVASHLSPDEFATHYQIGSTRYYCGKIIFAEIDTSYRNDFFDIERGLNALRPHEDGSPKSTKFIATYRVLEHMDFDAIQKLYIATQEGNCLELVPGEYVPMKQLNDLHMYAEICPVSTLVLTSFETHEFSSYMTDPDNLKGIPKLFFTSLLLDIDRFVEEFERNPFMPPPFKFLHPSKLREAITALRKPDVIRKVKGLTFHSSFDQIPFRRLRRGFWFVQPGKVKFFPLPPLSEIEENNYKFFRSM